MGLCKGLKTISPTLQNDICSSPAIRQPAIYLPYFLPILQLLESFNFNFPFLISYSFFSTRFSHFLFSSLYNFTQMNWSIFIPPPPLSKGGRVYFPINTPLIKLESLKGSGNPITDDQLWQNEKNPVYMNTVHT
jgi:hypothetical protein